MKNKILKISILVIIMVIGLVILTGCEYDYGTKQGTIVDKKYNEAYTSTTYTTTWTGKCMISIPMTRYNPENYNIKIQKEEDGETKECWVQITKEEYEKYKIGDYYNQ